MKSIARKSLVGLMLLAMTVLTSAQIAPPSKPRLTQRHSRNLGSQRSLPLRSQEPRLPAAVSPNIIWVQCPAEAQALGATCGTLPVPFDRDHPRRQMINIYFELYFHSNPGPAESAILLNPGGPGAGTTRLQGSRSKPVWS